MHPRDLASLADEETIFGGFAAEKLKRLQAELEPLSRHYDVVVANPPYMGSSNMNGWLSGWVKERFPDSKRDLCTCFIERGFGMLTKYGYSAMVTMESWMFLSSFERMRKNILHNHCIATMVYMNHMVMRIAFNTCATIFANHHSDSPGLYTKVEYQDLTEDGIPFEFPVKKHGPKHEKGALEALADPDCGWFYRTSAEDFNGIPGMPIVYWTTRGVLNAFKNGAPIGSIGQPRQGLATGENARFVRQWWEVSLARERFNCPSIEESVKSGAKWFPYNKGGEYRKWYGNNDCVVNWEKDGYEIRNYKDDRGKLLSRPQNTQCYFKPCITWSKISSGSIAFRYKPAGHVFDVAGTSIFAGGRELEYLQGACNSSVILQIAGMLSPTLNFEVGQIAAYPILFVGGRESDVCALAVEERSLSKLDWDAFESSWDFRRHPLL